MREFELDELVSAAEDDGLRGEESLSIHEVVNGVSHRRTGVPPRERVMVRRMDHRGNPLEIYLPGIPAIHERDEPFVSLNGWMMVERHDYSLLFTQGGAILVFDMDLWNMTRLRHGGSPLVVSWYEAGSLKARAFELRKG
jgi:hypothetical protein